MSTENKYPNADTPAERLAEIERKHPWLRQERKHDSQVNRDLRDLLAMLHERDAKICGLEKEIAIEGGVWDYENDCIKGEK